MERGVFVLLGGMAVGALGVLVILWVLSADTVTRLSGDQVEVAQFLQFDWSTVCLVSPQEFPDAECGSYDEAPGNTIFLSYLRDDGRCRLARLNGQLIEEGHSDTRCFSRTEATRLLLVKRGRVFSLVWTSLG